MIRRPSRRVRLLLYGVVPLVVLGGMVAMYYSGVGWLRRIVSPEASWIPAETRSEYGLLESLQNLLLAALVVVAAVGLRRKRLPWERLAVWVLLVGALFMLGEETDYGRHYLDLLGMGDGAARGVAGPFNLHRIGYLQAVLRNAAKFGVLTFFGCFAIVFAQSPRPLPRYLAPDRFAVLTVLLITALVELAWKLGDRAVLPIGSLDGHEEEFAELGTYYLALLYSVDMLFWRRYFPRKRTAPEE